jgi:hypothetical protein
MGYRRIFNSTGGSYQNNASVPSIGTCFTVLARTHYSTHVESTIINKIDHFVFVKQQ